jgi:hypothetical protein
MPRLSVLPSTLASVSAIATTAWVSGGSALLGALIGASAALGGQYLQWRLQRKERSEAARRAAVEEVLVRALSVSLMANQMTIAAHEFSSLSGFLARLLRVAKAFDYQGQMDGFRREIVALTRAGAQIWMAEDQEIVRLTNAVVDAATDAIDAFMVLPNANFIGKVLRLWRGTMLGDEAAISAARERVAAARVCLVEHLRRTLGLESIDLLARPDAWEPAGVRTPPIEGAAT